MNFTNSITAIAASAAALALTQAFAIQADNAASVMKIEPMQAISFDAGEQHAVTYFLSQNGECRLVVTLSGEPGTTAGFTATRFEATIEAGKTTRYVSENGGSIDFDCEPTARTVSVHTGQADAVAKR